MTVGLFLPPWVLLAFLAAGAFTVTLGGLSWFARALNRRRDPRPGYVIPPVVEPRRPVDWAAWDWDGWDAP